jgi:hypothetical protein
LSRRADHRPCVIPPRDSHHGALRMTIQATIWAMALRDVSPVAKLAAIYISDNFDETTRRASRPLSLAKIAEFSCATVSAASAALDELACIGVKVEIMDDKFICARLPVKS